MDIFFGIYYRFFVDGASTTSTNDTISFETLTNGVTISNTIVDSPIDEGSGIYYLSGTIIVNEDFSALGGQQIGITINNNGNAQLQSRQAILTLSSDSFQNFELFPQSTPFSTSFLNTCNDSNAFNFNEQCDGSNETISCIDDGSCVYDVNQVRFNEDNTDVTQIEIEEETTRNITIRFYDPDFAKSEEQLAGYVINVQSNQGANIVEIDRGYPVGSFSTSYFEVVYEYSAFPIGEILSDTTDTLTIQVNDPSTGNTTTFTNLSVLLTPGEDAPIISGFYSTTTPLTQVSSTTFPITTLTFGSEDPGVAYFSVRDVDQLPNNLSINVEYTPGSIGMSNAGFPIQLEEVLISETTDVVGDTDYYKITIENDGSYNNVGLTINTSITLYVNDQQGSDTQELTLPVQIQVEDCNGELNGGAQLNDCGVCYGGTGLSSSVPSTQGQDCDDNCHPYYGATVNDTGNDYPYMEDDCGTCRAPNGELGSYSNATPDLAISSCEMECNTGFCYQDLYTGEGLYSVTCVNYLYWNSEQDCTGECFGTNIQYICGTTAYGEDATNYPCHSGEDGQVYCSQSITDNCSEIPEGDCDCFGNQLDCAGVCGGTSILDCAGNCSNTDSYLGNNSDLNYNSEGDVGGTADNPTVGFDCTGECQGEAITNECGCVGGTNTEPFDDIDFCHGCADSIATNYSEIFTYDPECSSNTTPGQCNYPNDAYNLDSNFEVGLCTYNPFISSNFSFTNIAIDEQTSVEIPITVADYNSEEPLSLSVEGIELDGSTGVVTFVTSLEGNFEQSSNEFTLIYSAPDLDLSGVVSNQQIQLVVTSADGVRTSTLDISFVVGELDEPLFWTDANDEEVPKILNVIDSTEYEQNQQIELLLGRGVVGVAYQVPDTQNILVNLNNVVEDPEDSFITFTLPDEITTCISNPNDAPNQPFIVPPSIGSSDNPNGEYLEYVCEIAALPGQLVLTDASITNQSILPTVIEPKVIPITASDGSFSIDGYFEIVTFTADTPTGFITSERFTSFGYLPDSFNFKAKGGDDLNETSLLITPLDSDVFDEVICYAPTLNMVLASNEDVLNENNTLFSYSFYKELADGLCKQQYDDTGACGGEELSGGDLGFNITSCALYDYQEFLDVGVALGDDIIYGCTNSHASNYDEGANMDNGSCTFTTINPNIGGWYSSEYSRISQYNLTIQKCNDGFDVNYGTTDCVSATTPTDITNSYQYNASNEIRTIVNNGQNVTFTEIGFYKISLSATDVFGNVGLKFIIVEVPKILNIGRSVKADNDGLLNGFQGTNILSADLVDTGVIDEFGNTYKSILDDNDMDNRPRLGCYYYSEDNSETNWANVIGNKFDNLDESFGDLKKQYTTPELFTMNNLLGYDILDYQGDSTWENTSPTDGQSLGYTVRNTTTISLEYPEFQYTDFEWYHYYMGVGDATSFVWVGENDINFENLGINDGDYFSFGGEIGINQARFDDGGEVRAYIYIRAYNLDGTTADGWVTSVRTAGIKSVLTTGMQGWETFNLTMQRDDFRFAELVTNGTGNPEDYRFVPRFAIYHTTSAHLVQTGNSFARYLKITKGKSAGLTGLSQFSPDIDARSQISLLNNGTQSSLLYEYYDKFLQPQKYEETTSPTTIQFFFYIREQGTNIFDTNRTTIPFDIGGFVDGSNLYLYDIDWGDGSPKEFNENTGGPKKLENNLLVTHNYQNYGIFKIKGWMFTTVLSGIVNTGVKAFKRFEYNININKPEVVNIDDYNFIPYDISLPIVGGISYNSIYYKSINRQLGYISDGVVETSFQNYRDRYNSELALSYLNENLIGQTVENFTNIYYQPSNSENEADIIYDGYHLKLFGELGSSIDNSDIAQVRYLEGNFQMYELLGFTDINAGNPNNQRYWKNIIPPDYDIVKDRYGFSDDFALLVILTIRASDLILDTVSTAESIEIRLMDSGICDVSGCNDYWLGIIDEALLLNLDDYDLDINGDGFVNVTDVLEITNLRLDGKNNWVGDYYYPVLPNLDKYGKFTDGLQENRTPFGDRNEWDSVDDDYVTSEKVSSKFINNVLIDLSFRKTNNNKLVDVGGNNLNGILINDFRLNFDLETQEPTKGGFVNKSNINRKDKAY